MHTHKCLMCFKPFTPLRSDGKFCSGLCRDRCYRANNKDKITELQRRNAKKPSSIAYKAQWHQDNKERNTKNTEAARKKRLLADPEGERAKDAKRNREWRAKNRERYLAIQRRAGEKRRRDPRYRLSQSVAQSMRDGLHGNKTDSFVILVGYSIERLAIHLENQFDEYMTWDNYGSYWHVDHIIPVTAFNYETPSDQDFQKCWSLENLRPLEAKENIAKGSKLATAFQPSLLI